MWRGIFRRSIGRIREVLRFMCPGWFWAREQRGRGDDEMKRRHDA